MGKGWIGVMVGVMLSSVALAKGGIDPFYLSLLEEGKRDLQSQEWINAGETLRIACFGMLEEPDSLVECLVWLSVAEQQYKAEEAYLKTFGRILRLEEQFSAYSKASLTDPQRESFKETVLRKVPRSVLDTSAIFSQWIPVPPQLAEEPEEGSEPMTVSEERRMLRRKIKKEPEISGWTVRLARLEIENGREDRGEKLLDALLGESPVEEGFCLRGRLYVQSARWLKGAEDLVRCSAVTQDPELTIAMVEAQMELGELAVAESMVMPISDSQRSSEKAMTILKRLRLKIQNRSQGNYFSVDEADTLERLRGKLKEQLASKDLRLARDELALVAERHPFDQDLQYWVGEVSYRVSDWESAWRYLSLDGGPGIDSPERLFYLAVAAHHLGHNESAEEAMRLALPYLSKTVIVETYTERILN